MAAPRGDQVGALCCREGTLDARDTESTPGIGTRFFGSRHLQAWARSSQIPNTPIVSSAFKFSVIDPAKVVHIALQHAASVAGILITTEVMMADTGAEGPGPAEACLAAWAVWKA